MLDTSPVMINKAFDEPSRNLYNPGFASSKFSFNSKSHLGCVKSPVPITWMPFLSAHWPMLLGFKSCEQALEYLECICKSAIIRISFIIPKLMNNEQYLRIAIKAAKKAGPIFKKHFGKAKD